MHCSYLLLSFCFYHAPCTIIAENNLIMIIGSLNDTARIERSCPALSQVFNYVRTHLDELLKAAPGRIVLDGERIFLNVDDATLRPKDRQVLEAHRRYVDIHFPLSGSEEVGWRNMQTVSVPSNEPFNEERDFAFYAQQADVYFTVQPGTFYVMFPEDAHAPIIGQGSLRKVVAKVRMDVWESE